MKKLMTLIGLHILLIVSAVLFKSNIYMLICLVILGKTMWSNLYKYYKSKLKKFPRVKSTYCVCLELIICTVLFADVIYRTIPDDVFFGPVGKNIEVYILIFLLSFAVLIVNSIIHIIVALTDD